MEPQDPPPHTASRRNEDLQTFQEFVTLLPVDSPILKTLSGIYYGDPIPLNELNSLDGVIDFCARPDKEFLDPELEQLRKTLASNLVELSMRVCFFFERVENEHGDVLCVFPKDNEEIKTLAQEQFSQIPSQYEELIRQARRKLVPDELDAVKTIDQPASSSSQLAQHPDQELFDELLRMLPPDDEAIRFLKHHDFHGLFELRTIDEIRYFTGLGERPDKCFLNEQLEQDKRALIEELKDVRWAVLDRTIALDDYGTPRVVPEDGRAEAKSFPPEQYENVVAELTAMARHAANTYDAFVRNTRRTLLTASTQTTTVESGSDLAQVFTSESAEPVPSPNQFRRYGDGWLISYEGIGGQFSDLRGFHYIHELMRRRRDRGDQEGIDAISLLKEVVVMETRHLAHRAKLEMLDSIADGEGPPNLLSNNDPVADSKYRESLRRAIEETKENIAEAVNDLGSTSTGAEHERIKRDELEPEIQKLKQLEDREGKIFGLQGRIRSMSTDNIDKARQSIRHAIRTALKRLCAANPSLESLANHFERSIPAAEAGVFVYSPENLPEWQLE